MTALRTKRCLHGTRIGPLDDYGVEADTPVCSTYCEKCEALWVAGEHPAQQFTAGLAAPTDPLVSFLTEYRAELETRCRAHMDEGDASDDEGAHIGFARHHRALASGLDEAINALDEMWRKVRG